MIRNILVPTDFSEGSRAALDCARELASALGASLHVMHVVESPFALGTYMEIYAPPPADYFTAMEESSRRQLEALLTEEEKVKFRAVLTTVIGLPAQEILARLDAEPAIDLVVMATHGRGGVARFMMGSVADHVVRAARCPVLTLKEHRHGATVQAA